MENKKNYKGLIVLVVVLFICILGLIGYIIFDKINEKEQDKVETNNTTTITTISENIEEIKDSNNKLPQISLGICDKKMCDKTFKNYNFKYYPQTNGMESTLTLNDKELLNDIYWLNDIYILDNVIIVITSSTDIRTTKIHIFDELGNKQKEIYNLDNNYQEMVIMDGIEGAITITEEGIIIKGTRTTHGPSLAFDYSDNNSTIEDYYLGRCDIYNKYAEENIYGTYELKYLGDNKFSDLQNIDYTKLKDSDITCSN